MTAESAEPTPDAGHDATGHTVIGDADREPEEPLSQAGLWLRAGILVLDGFLVALFAVFFLPQWIGSVPMPISGVLAGLANAGLVFLAIRVLGRPYGIAPVAGFALGVLLCMIGGPGGDVLIPNDWRMLVLVVGGFVPPLIVLFRVRMRAVGASDTPRRASSE